MLQADHVRRPEPPKLASPWLGRVLATILFGDGPLSQESIAVIAPFLSVHARVPVVRSLREEK
jgi:hypothetical protein